MGRPSPLRSYESLCRDVANRYSSRPAHFYVRAKLWVDPVSRTLHELGERESYDRVLDVGCGRGQVSLMLRVAGLASSVRGVDWDDAKIRHAKAAAVGLDQSEFEHGDVRDRALPAADTVLLVDILHYLGRDEQHALLRRAARAARSRILLRDVDPERGASSAFTTSWERLTTKLGYNQGECVSPQPCDELERILDAEGFAVTRQPCAAFGLSNALLVARRVSRG